MGIFKDRFQTSGLCRLDRFNNSERSSKKFITTNEAPYQMLGQPTLSSILGYKELSCAHFWLSLLSECLSSYLYVFIVCSTRISWTGAIIGHEPNLLAMSLASGMAMMLLIFTFRTVHVNPALTLSFLSTGRIPIMRAVTYILAQCLGAIAAIAFLYSVSIKGHSGALGMDNPHEGLLTWQILIVELVISFVVTIATYATCNYSSYSSAKKFIQQQLGQNSSLLWSACDSEQGIPSNHHSKRSVAPIVYSGQEDSINYDYEYDNHRIYATQQLKSESTGSPQVPIEEIMQDECQLLAPNGFPLHVTSGQAFIIGFAYALTSLCGIPASGASLNPARSLGPAFIMNRWDRHWIYWLGPILGSVIAGFFYEFVFSPTRRSSLCYRPKLFRLSAQDMAKVGSKSRLYQQRSNVAPILPPQTSATIYRPQVHHPQILHSPTTRATFNQTIAAPTHPKPSSSTMVHHLQPSTQQSSNIEHLNFIQNHQRHQIHDRVQASSFDRSKSTTIINSLSNQPQQQQHQHLNQILAQKAGLKLARNNADFGKFPMSRFVNAESTSNSVGPMIEPTFSEL